MQQSPDCSEQQQRFHSSICDPSQTLPPVSLQPTYYHPRLYMQTKN